MKRTIASLMQPHVESVGMDDSVREVQARMLNAGLSWLPVREPEGTIVGVIEAVDLLRVHAEGHDVDTVRAWESCRYKPVLVPAEASVEEVAQLMLLQHVRHVIVTGASGAQGVVSTSDLLRVVAAAA